MTTPFRTQRGFTLIETLVAITVMTIAILAPFAAVQTVIKASNLSRDQLVASSLAQEGMEYVRFVRYTNYLQSGQSSDFNPLLGMNGTNGPNCRSSRRCTIDAQADPYSGSTMTGMAACSGTALTSCGVLYRTAEGLYTQQSTTGGNANEATTFRRSVSLTDHGAYLTAIVTVTWTDHGNHSIVLQEDMYDWL